MSTPQNQTLPDRRDETLGGYVVHNIPFPIETDPDSLAFLKKMSPITIEQEYSITYLHSYGQDSPWFAGLTNRRLLASQEPATGYTYANPRGHDMYSGKETRWIDITERPGAGGVRGCKHPVIDAPDGRRSDPGFIGLDWYASAPAFPAQQQAKADGYLFCAHLTRPCAPRPLIKPVRLSPSRPNLSEAWDRGWRCIAPTSWGDVMHSSWVCRVFWRYCCL
jgi:hypothetical protein